MRLTLLFFAFIFTASLGAQSPDKSIFQNRGAVRDFAISPDGQWLVLAHEHEALTLWDTRNGAQKASYLGFRYSPMCVTFSPDGRFVAVGSGDSLVRVLSIPALRLVSALEGHLNWVYDVEWHPKRNEIISGSTDSTIAVWSKSGSPMLRQLKKHKDWVWTVLLSHDQKHLYSSAGSKELYRWDYEEGELVTRFYGHHAAIFGLAEHPQKKQLASASWDGTVRIWNSHSGNEVQILTPRGAMQAICYSPDGKFLVVADKGGNIYIYETKNWQKEREFQAHAGGIYALKFQKTEEGLMLLSGGADGYLKFWGWERIMGKAFRP